MIKIMLPPLPGTNTPHPAFRLNYGIASVDGVVIKDKHGFSIIAAAAIAHFWGIQESYLLALKADAKIFKQACDQSDKWSSIAAGSRDYDGAEIVGYHP